MSSVPAKALCQSLPQLSPLKALQMSGLSEFSDEAVTRLVASITHRTLKHLKLSEINLPSAVAEALGQLLPQLSA